MTDQRITPPLPPNRTTTPERTRVRVLSDEPTNEDKFDSHRRLAVAIRSLIAESGLGCAIGLEGNYGSGKSSVIEMLSGELTEDAHIFIFDAWEHRGDPLRLVFLQELVASLYTHNWFTEAQRTEWEQTFDEIQSRRVVTTRVEVPQPNLKGLIALAVLTLIPAMAALYGPLTDLLAASAAPRTLVEALGFRQTPTDYSAWTILLLTPALIIPAYLFWRAGRRLFRRQHAPSDRSEPLLPLFSGQTLGESRDVVHGIGNQTSREFQEHYSKVQSQVLTGYADRRLVLVIDNLDRVDPDEARDIWSTMRIFTHSADIPLRNRTWMVVPYDRAALDRVWGDAEAASSRGDAAAFLDKTFRVRFHVPTFLLVAWEGYFKEKLAEALPYWGVAKPGTSQYDEAHASYIVLSAHFDSLARSPTPREINTILNEVAAVVAQRGEECGLPLQQLVQYVLLYRTQGGPEGVRRVVKSGEAVSIFLREALGTDPEIGLAMLAFGTLNRADAEEILVLPELTDALRKGDADTVKAISTRPWFWTVFQRIAYSLVAHLTNSGVNLMTAAEALHLGLGGSSKSKNQKELVRQVARDLAIGVGSHPMSASRGRGMAAVMRLAPETERTVRLVELAFQAELPNMSMESDLDLSWGDGLEAIVLAAQEVGDGEVLKRTLVLQSDSARVARALGTIGSRPVLRATLRGRIAAKVEDLGAELLPTLQRLPWPEWRSRAIEVILESGSDITAQQVIASTKTAFESFPEGDEISAINLLRLVRSLQTVATSEFKGLQKYLVVQGWAMHFAGLASKAGKTDEFAEWIALIADRGPISQAPTSRGMGSLGLKAVNEMGDEDHSTDDDRRSLVRALGEYTHRDALRHMLGDSAMGSQVPAVLIREAMKSGLLTNVVSEEHVVSSWLKIREVLNQEGALKTSEGEFLRCLIEYRPLLERLSKEVLEWPLTNLVWEMLRVGFSKHSAFLSYVQEQVARWTKEQWVAELEARADTSALVVELRRVDPESPMSVAGRDSLLTVAERVSAGTVVLGEEVEAGFEALLRVLTVSEARMLGQRIIEGMASMERGGFERMVKVYEVAIARAIETMPAGAFLGHVGFVVNGRLEREGTWVAEQIKKYPRVVEEAAEHEREDFGTRVREWVIANGDSQAALELSKLFIE
jgi:hypothetical protein